MNDLERVHDLLRADVEELHAKARRSVGTPDGWYDAAKASGIEHAIELLDSELALSALDPDAAVENLDWLWYEGWVCDFRKGGRGADNNPTLNGMHEQQFFIGRNMGDPSRSNVQVPGQLSSVGSNSVLAVGVIASFTDPQLLEEFFRGSRFEVFVGNKTYFQAPTAALLDRRAVIAGRSEKVRSMISASQMPSVGHQLCAIQAVRKILVPERASFSLRMSIQPTLGNMLFEHQEAEEEGSYAGFLWLVFTRRERHIL